MSKLNRFLKQFFMESVMTPESRALNEWLRTPDMMPSAMLYANGRFQGLFPGLPAGEGFGGHPGLLYKLLMCALCYGIPFIGISVSGTMDSTKNPLSYEQKEEILQDILAQLRIACVPLILSFAERVGYSGITAEQIEARVSGIRVEFQRLTNPFSMVLQFKDMFETESGTHIDTLIMASGLEASKSKGEYNKYGHTFDKLVGPEDEDKPFQQIHFLLTSREGKDTISGTKIRELILSGDYEQLGRLALDAGFTTEKLMHDYGDMIPAVKLGLRRQLSQEQEEYKLSLQDWMVTHAFDDLQELNELRANEEKTEEDMGRLAYLESREPFLLEFTGQTAGRKTKRKTKKTKKTKKPKRKTRKTRKIKGNPKK